MDEALAAYEQTRNQSEMSYYEFTSQLATLDPPPLEVRELLSALQHNPEQRSRWFGVFAHTVPVQEFFAPENVQRIMSGKMIGAGG